MSDPFTLLLLQVAALLVTSRALGLVMRRLGQPVVMAEILAGIALGPSLLGHFWPDALAVLFPPASLSVLKLLSQVGLVLFMFLVGLEFDPALLRGRTRHTVAISHASIAVPFALGMAAAWWIGPGYAPPDVSPLSVALFLGIAMSVTAFPVLARILSERGLTRSRVGAISIACAAVDDVTAWCLLPFVIAVARARAPTDALGTTGLALAFIAAMVFLVRPFLRRAFPGAVARQGASSAVIASALLFLVASSAVAEIVGIHALFGAFLAGAVFPKAGTVAARIVEKLETIVLVLLLPLFFAYSGLRTDIDLVSGPREWLVTAGLILVATVGKFGGSAVTARVTGLGWREASAIGVLMNTRGLMELVVLNIGLDAGILSPTLFTMMVLMALVTTFATTPIVRWIYPDHELTRDRVAERRRAGGS
jgi:Kef-type K+ transport system membrane component KefB